MRPRPVSHYLARFGAPLRDAPAEAAAPAGLPEEAVEEKDVAADLDEAREAGRAAGREEAAREHEAALLAREEAFERWLAEARATWAREQGERLAARLEAALARIEDDLRESVAASLRPALEAAIAARVVEELSDAARAALRRGGPLITASGPADLLEALRAALGEDAASLDFVPDATAEARVVCGRTLIESRLEAFRRSLAQATE